VCLVTAEVWPAYKWYARNTEGADPSFSLAPSGVQTATASHEPPLVEHIRACCWEYVTSVAQWDGLAMGEIQCESCLTTR